MSPERLAFTLGVSCSTLFSGANLALTYHCLPALLLSPPLTPSDKPPSSAAALLARQWQLIFHRGHMLFPGSTTVSAAAFFYAGRHLPVGISAVRRRLYYLATCLDVAVVPFTFIFLSRINAEMLRRAAIAEKGAEEKKNRACSGSVVETCETGALIRWWGALGAIRAVFPMMAIVAAVAAGLDTAAFSGSFSTETMGLIGGVAVLIFMVIRFGVPPVEV